MIAVAITHWNREKALVALLLLAGLVGAVFAFTFSYFSNANVLIGLGLFPLTLFITGPKRNNVIYIMVMVLFAALSVAYQVRIFYFFTLAFYFLWLTELFAGRLNVLILFLIVFMSPFFIQVITILGFPLRLMLSSFAGALLSLADVDVQIDGNMITLDGAMFSVDEACMGLNMLVISLLMGVFVLAFRYRVSGRVLGLYSSALFFIVVFILNMVTNVIRIIGLVYFRIPPENWIHEFVGILCLILYVVIPLHFLGEWLVRKYGKQRRDAVSQPVLTRRNIVFVIVLPLVVLFAGATFRGGREPLKSNHVRAHFGTIKSEMLGDGIAKISTNDLLIYIKPIPEFFTGEHTPLMCWKGSGYELSGVATSTVAGRTIYKGTLVKDGRSLHTAWWYSNGQVETISQLDWRLRMLKGEPDFCLVNVTAENEQILMEAVSSMFATKSLVIQS